MRGNLPAKDLPELIALAKSKPGTLNYSSAGSGSSQNLSGELFKLKTGTQITHVPYKGSSPSIAALIAGEVDLTFANIPAILQHVKSGRIRPQASTGEKRAQLMPDVPTLREAGVNGVSVNVWYGVLVPAATPKPIVQTLATAIAKAASSDDVRSRLLDQGAEPVGNTPEEFDRILREEVARWKEVIDTAKLSAD